MHFLFINRITVQVCMEIPMKNAKYTNHRFFLKQKIHSENLLQNFQEDKHIIQGRSMTLDFFLIFGYILARWDQH